MKRGQPKRTRMSQGLFYLMTAAVIAFGVGQFAAHRSTDSGSGQSAAVQAVDTSLFAGVPGISSGDPNAPVTIYEFSDFQCPACGQFARSMMPQIRKRLIEPGLVRWVFYDYPLPELHPNALIAARAARCANEQGAFWAYHDALYEQQAAWSLDDDPRADFSGLANELQMDTTAFASCLESTRLDSEVERTRRLGEAAHVRGTPSVVINSTLVSGVPPLQVLESMVREAAR